jgi:hypothetical protein
MDKKPFNENKKTISFNALFCKNLKLKMSKLQAILDYRDNSIDIETGHCMHLWPMSLT